MLLAVLPRGVEPCLVIIGNESGDHFARNDVKAWSTVRTTEHDENVEVARGMVVLALLAQDPRFLPNLIRFALNSDRRGRRRIGGEDVDAAGVAERDRGDVAAPG
jgi:hypothetical protein